MAKETFTTFIHLMRNSSSAPTSPLVMNVCCNKISVFRKKKPCAECKRQFCSQCLQRCGDRALRCKICSVLTMRPPLRSALLELRVKDLRFYLDQHNVSTRGCVEKEDLVNVVLRYASYPGHPSNEGIPPRNSSESSSNNLNGVSANQTDASSHSPTAISGSAQTLEQIATSQVLTSEAQIASSISHTEDSDSSSSDTSFEMIPRLGSDDLIISAPSSMSSMSEVSGHGHQDSSAPVSADQAAARSNLENDQVNTTTTSRPSDGVSRNPESSIGSIHTNATTTSSTPAINVDSDLVAGQNAHIEQENFAHASISQPASSNNSSNNSPNLLRGTMASISSEADFEVLSVKNLKDILHRHRVNYHGCCEKGELIDKAKRLYRDYCSSRAELEKLDLDELCKICMDAPVECVMLECGHMATCTECGRQLSQCPICRQFVVRIVRTFKA